MKIDSLNLESQIQAKNIPVVFSNSPIKTSAKSVQGSSGMIGQTNNPTEISTFYI